MRIILSLIIFVGGYTLQAQNTAAIPMSLEECLAYALQNNQNYKIAELENDRSDAQVREIISQGLPQATVRAGLNYNYEVQTSLIDASNFDPTAPEGTEIGCRQEQHTAGPQHSSHLLESLDGVDPKMLEDLVEHDRIESLVPKRCPLPLQIAFSDIEAEACNRSHESLGSDIDSADFVAEFRKSAGCDERYRSALENLCVRRYVLLDDSQVGRQARSVLSRVVREPLGKRGIVRSNAVCDGVEQLEALLCKAPWL